ncbi:hypothetical protein BDF20DRAFT_893618 [Mycotypha africana]|uniref:uncharacterized protein n=1 Tax=Mycotypha africana TaxID=64632 RepID=UPI0023013F45|nr:uncharacterized protein BDF20DRAFT_893618 [Mycotypha africana]KAI8969184.1 hypothetical protein BDF20DRAFT_893618 [Mycotypha africana]
MSFQKNTVKSKFPPTFCGSIKITAAKYSTSLDSRGFLPVYEYLIHGQPIMWDRETGHVHFTGIWKALGKSKTEIAKMVQANPNLKVKKIRGGCLKIQGTWIPMESAYALCKKVAWKIRKKLVPLFGKRIVDEAIRPSHADYGSLLLDTGANDASSASSSFSVPAASASASSSLSAAGSSSSSSSSSASASASFPPLSRRSTGEDIHMSSTTAATAAITRKKTKKPIERFQPYCRDNGRSAFKNISNLSNIRRSSRISNRKAAAALAAASTSTLFSFPSSTAGSSLAYNDVPSGECGPTIGPESRLTMNITTVPTGLEEEFSMVENVHSQTLNSYQTAQDLPNCPSSSPLPPVTEPALTETAHGDSYITYRVPANISADSTAIELIDIIKAGIALQQLSQDDGTRPILPLDTSLIPSKVVARNQEYNIHWSPYDQ